MAGLLTAAATPAKASEPVAATPAKASGPPTMQSTAPSGTPIGTSPNTPTLQQLMPATQTAGTFAASNGGTAAPTGNAPTASAQLASPLAGISNGMINPNDNTNAASQLNAITASNSPYIQQAEQQGLLTAASRGLENSSIGAGNAEAAAVQAAAPLAEQNAASATQGQLQNSQLGTQAAEFNASQQEQNQQLNAQLQTQQTQFNASQTQAAAATNTAAQNAMTQQAQQLDEQISQQYLSGSQAQTLAGIQGQYNELIASNSSASSMYTSMMNGISATMANQNISPGRVADTIQADVSLLESGMGIINSLNGGSTNVNVPATTSYTTAGGAGFGAGATTPALTGKLAAKP